MKYLLGVTAMAMWVNTLGSLIIGWEITLASFLIKTLISIAVIYITNKVLDVVTK